MQRTIVVYGAPDNKPQTVVTFWKCLSNCDECRIRFYCFTEKEGSLEMNYDSMAYEVSGQGGDTPIKEYWEAYNKEFIGCLEE